MLTSPGHRAQGTPRDIPRDSDRGKMPSVEIPAEYGYVVLINGVGSCCMLIYLGSQVIAARKKYDVKLPNLYATPGFHKDADKFNNVQRGHQNTLELYPSYLALSLLGGLKHPHVVAGGGVLYIAGRIGYAAGYKADAENRYAGGMFALAGLFASFGSAISMGYSLLNSK